MYSGGGSRDEGRDDNVSRLSKVECLVQDQVRDWMEGLEPQVFGTLELSKLVLWYGRPICVALSLLFHHFDCPHLTFSPVS